MKDARRHIEDLKKKTIPIRTEDKETTEADMDLTHSEGNLKN